MSAKKMQQQSLAPWRQTTMFQELEAHFSSFDEGERVHLAAIYEASEATSTGLAAACFMYPERVLFAVERHVHSANGFSLLEHMALEHGISIVLDWLDETPYEHRQGCLVFDSIFREDYRLLSCIGVVPPMSKLKDHEDVRTFPAALSSLFASKFHNVRPSLPILLGRLDGDALIKMAGAHGINPGPRMGMIALVCARFEEHESLGRIVAPLPDPDWLGISSLVLELGGMCYWQDIFGPDAGLDEAQKAHNIVPLIPVHQRNHDLKVAEQLLSLGLMFKFSDDQKNEKDEKDAQKYAHKPEFTMLAIPEEVWLFVWMESSTWYMEWTHSVWAMLEEGALGAAKKELFDGAHRTLKWLVCEAEHGDIKMDTALFSDDSVASLVCRSSYSAERMVWHLEFAAELGLLALDADGAVWKPVDDAFEVLDTSRASFVRHALRSWCMGNVGRRADASLNAALGLDESWRVAMVDLLQTLDAEGPAWMGFPGVSSELTGLGFLRSMEEHTQEQLTAEYRFAKSYICSAKMLFLDLLSVLPAQRWYSMRALCELFQFVSANALFYHMRGLVEPPGVAMYVPVQRASFLTDPFHSEHFMLWLGGCVHELFEALGVAQLDEEGARVFLDTRMLCVESPVGMPDEHRQEFVQRLLESSQFVLSIPTEPHLKMWPTLTLAPDLDDTRISVDLPMEQLMSMACDSSIVSFDGVYMHVETPEVK